VHQSSKPTLQLGGKTSKMYADLRVKSGSKCDESVTRLSAEIGRCISVMSDEQQPASAESTLPMSASAREPLDAASSSVLFRTFAVAIKKMKGENDKLKSAQFCRSKFPEWRNNDGLLVGMSALESNLFRLRIVGGAFSLIAFALMMTVEDLPNDHFHPYAQSWVSC
jgi:hypothetical protein